MKNRLKSVKFYAVINRQNKIRYKLLTFVTIYFTCDTQKTTSPKGPNRPTFPDVHQSNQSANRPVIPFAIAISCPDYPRVALEHIIEN